MRKIKTNLNEKNNSFAKRILHNSELTQEIKDSIIHPFVDKALKDFIPSPLLSYEHEYERKTLSAWKTLQEYAEKIENGIQILQRAGIELGSSIETPKDPQIHQKMIENGKSPQEILGISNTTMMNAYEEACNQYKNKNYTEATNILEVLLYLNPTPSIYWQLFGMAEHSLDHLESAIEALNIGLQKGSSSLVPYAHLINCLVNVKRREEATQLIQTALKIEHPTDSNATTIQEALGRLEQVLKRQ